MKKLNLLMGIAHNVRDSGMGKNGGDGVCKQEREVGNYTQTDSGI